MVELFGGFIFVGLIYNILIGKFCSIYLFLYILNKMLCRVHFFHFKRLGLNRFGLNLSININKDFVKCIGCGKLSLVAS